ncbi:MAG: hypothetical protein QNJ40_10695 [Xanthomonadales bacterium]|nr:hypothetical protein [Xanthomonadales bacterium]
MKILRFMTALITTLLGVSAQGVEINGPVLDLTPATVMPGTPFVASLEGTYSQSCLLGPGVVTGSYSNDGFEIKFRTANNVPSCDSGSFMGTEHFGAFRLPENAVNFLNPDLPMKVTFIVDGTEVAVSELDLTFDPAEMPHLALSSGVYWDAAYNGSGMAIEDMGDFLFVAGFMFNGTGDAVWRTAQGPLVGGTLDTTFLGFANGACIACGETGIDPTLVQDTEPVQFMVRGTGEAFLSFGNSPDRAVHLVRFDAQPLPGEERAPMLIGSWTFVDRDTGMVLDDVLFEEVARSGSLTVIQSEDQKVSVECYDYTECRLTLDGVFEELDRCEVTPDRILGSRLFGFRTR